MVMAMVMVMVMVAVIAVVIDGDGGHSVAVIWVTRLSRCLPRSAPLQGKLSLFSFVIDEEYCLLASRYFVPVTHGSVIFEGV